MSHSIKSYLVDNCGLWLDRRGAAGFLGKPALFLDRDGVIVEETHYLGRAEDVSMIPTAGSCVRRANLEGIPVVVVTNQAGIGRGYYDWAGFAAVQTRIDEHLEGECARLDMILACAYHSDGKPPFDKNDHPWRKPRDGMIQAAQSELGVDLEKSLIIGDKISDLKSGEAAGIGFGVLVRTGHGAEEEPRFDPDHFGIMKTGIADDIEAAYQAALSAGWLQHFTTNCGASTGYPPRVQVD
ncbi:hypothetical protein GCM10011316_39750 [Roseibium aquae]|uniref:D,D-heptose 1,7-bisphosphate phosphatase n=1 Tax=Roseibium aquae TaxID=1323746 RepID=A0A916TPY9_9HYPH|nr:HAD-IIIA family hydrolase [Roseibium aquae]GGB63988.1 hypothetical protein GCM10011316_39750 [Roseibium aquae]